MIIEKYECPECHKPISYIRNHLKYSHPSAYVTKYKNGNEIPLKIMTLETLKVTQEIKEKPIKIEEDNKINKEINKEIKEDNENNKDNKLEIPNINNKDDEVIDPEKEYKYKCGECGTYFNEFANENECPECGTAYEI